MDAFTLAVDEIFREIGFSSLSRAQPQPRSDNDEIFVSVGITGALQGYLSLSSSLKAAHQFVGKMLDNMGMQDETEGFGEMQREAMGEIVNQLSGRSAMHLADRGFDCDITPPTIITGSRIHTDYGRMDYLLEETFSGPFGLLDLEVALKKR